MSNRNMRFDMHCHIAAEGTNDIGKIHTDVYYKPLNDELILKIGAENMKKDLVEKYKSGTTNGKVSLKNYSDLLLKHLSESTRIDAVVLLAFDGVYSPADFQRPDGFNEKKNTFYEHGTELIVSNQLVYNLVKDLNSRLPAGKKFYWGASINPNRDSASLKAEMDFIEGLRDNKPALMKWVPSYHHIDLADANIQSFYKWLVDQKLPLLCHVGPEFAYSESYKDFNKKRDHYTYLKHPLQAGVNVIAPHCVAPFFMTDINEVNDFIKFMRDWNSTHPNKLWVDNSGTSNPTTFLGASNSPMFPRISRMREFVSKYPKEYMLHGTDFPVPIADKDSFSKVPNTTKLQEKKNGGFPWPHVSAEFYKELDDCHNFYDLDASIKEHYGYAEETFTNAARVLRLV